MSSPRVSIILPTHNRAWCLRSTLMSVMEQTFHDFELIVVDDGSTDGTDQVLEEFPGLILVRNEKKAGVSHAPHQNPLFLRQVARKGSFQTFTNLNQNCNASFADQTRTQPL